MKKNWEKSEGRIEAEEKERKGKERKGKDILIQIKNGFQCTLLFPKSYIGFI